MVDVSFKVTQSKERTTTSKNNFDPPIYIFFLSPIVASVIIKLIEVQPNKK